MSSQGVTITVNAESEAAAEKLKEFFDGAVEGVDRLSKASEFLEEFAGKLLAALSVGALIEFTREAINTAEAMGTLSRQVGFTLQTLAALKTQANENGIQFEELRMGLTHFNSMLQEASMNGGQAMQAFRNLSHEIAIAVSEGRPAEEVYRMIAERFKEMPDGIQKSAAAQQLFGRASAQWVTLLNEGVAGLEKIKETGGGFTAEGVASATLFNRTLRELHEQLELIFLNLATQILPTLQQVVDWIKQLTQNTDTAGHATGDLAESFKALVSAALVTGAIFVDLGRSLGTSAAGWVEVYNTALTIVQEIAAQIKAIYQDIVFLTSDMIDVLQAAAKAAFQAATGQFKTAAGTIKKEIDGVKDDLDSLDSHLSAAFGNIPAQLTQFISNAQALHDGLISGLIKQWTGISDFLTKLWADTASKSKTAVAAAGGAPGNQAPGSQGDTRLKGDMARLEFEREQVQLQQKILETDPTLTQQERLQKLLPDMLQETSLIAQQIALQKSVANDKSFTEEERMNANREIVKLQLQQLQISRQMVEATHPWQTSMAGAVQHLKDMNNLSKETAQSFENVFNTAISSISDNFSKLIEGTESWGQALRNIGSAILNEIISAIVTMAVRWLMTSVMMAAFGEALIESTSALYAAAWAGPAILATIASFGSAALAAPLEVMGALAFAPAVSAESIAAREHGGSMMAGRLHMVGEAGRELVVPDSDAHVFNAADTSRLVSSLRSSSQSNAGAGGSPMKMHIIFMDDQRRVEKQVRDNPEVHRIIVDVARRNARHILPSSS